MNMHDNEKSASRARSPRGPFKSLVVLGESTVEGGGWLSGPQERVVSRVFSKKENHGRDSE